MDLALKQLGPNKYMNVYIVNGKIQFFEVKKRWIGFLTLGVSTWFTRPWINVYGIDTCLNQRCYQKIRRNTIFNCINYLKDDFDLQNCGW